MDPAMIQSMLVQQLGGKTGQPGSFGGGMGGPQMQSQTSAANLTAQIAQKAMLMKALQGAQARQAQQQAQAMIPGTEAANANVVGQNPQVQAMYQQMQQPFPQDPSLMGAGPSQ